MKSLTSPFHPFTLSFFRLFAVSLFMSLTVASCGLLESDAQDPNEIGGETNLEMTEVGQKFDVYADLYDFIPDGYIWEDSIIVTKRSSGVVTMDVNLRFEEKVIYTLDSLFGTQNLPRESKLAILDAVLEKYGATIDTSEKGFIRIHAEPKFKITSEGIQEYVNSNGDQSKPFTIIKYNAKVGDKYTFKRSDGTTITRTVTYHSTDDDYEVGFWLLKVFKTEEVVPNDPLFQKIIYVTNHKYGTVGAHIFTKDGKEIRLGIWPPTL